MNRYLQMKLNQYANTRKARRKWLTVAASLCVVVAIGISYLLINPANTQVAKTYCGYEEHVEHNEDCYQETRNLICPISEEDHTHIESCFEPIFTCGQEETDGHQHTDECRKVELVCEKPIHKHTLQCFSNPEADVETSSVWERAFAKAKLSGNWNEDVLTIAKTQLGYAESKRNYLVKEDGTTIKGYTRYGDWYGDAYGDWRAMFCSFCMNYAGVDRNLIPFEADCQTWVNELSSEKYDLFHSAGTYTPAPGDLIFFDWDNDDSADHVGFVYKIFETEHNKSAKITTIEGNSRDAVCENTYEITDNQILGYGKLPENPNESLDLAECDCQNVGIPLISHSDHCARKAAVKSICDEYTAEKLYRIWNQLPENVQDFAMKYLGWSYEGQQKRDELQRLLEEGLPDPENIEEERTVKTVEGDDFTVTVTYGESAELPEEAELRAEEIAIDSEKYQEDYQQMINEMLTQGYAEDEKSLQISYARFFDIGFYLDDEEIEPKTPVEIEILCDDNVQMNPGENGFAIHFGESGLEIVNVEVSVTADTNTVQSFSFEQNGFSDTAIVIAPLPPRTNAVIFDGTNGIATGNGTGNSNNNIAGESYYKGARKMQVSLTNGKCVLPTTDDIKTDTMEHNYKIAGWYDVVNGNYYGEELLGTEVEIQGPNTPYFYADWVDADYSPSGTEKSIDTPYIGNFVTTRFFDYNELFDIEHATLRGSASAQPVKGLTYSGWNFNTANPGLIFYADNYDGSWDADCTSGTGHLGSIYHNGTPARYRYNDNITTGLYSAAEIQRLFAPESETLGKTYVGEADHFYTYDPTTGYYEYDSTKNAATYNKNDGRVYLYNNVVRVGNISTQYNSALQSDGFLPFNKGNDTSITYPTTGGRANYWFGMSSEIQFYLPSNSGTGSQNKVNGQDMVFNFSGDDDVWVLVDDTLVLDIGGIHPRKSASINFATGVCTTDGTRRTLSFSEGAHTLTIYYMERGGNQSNARIQFNIMPTYDLILTKKENDEEGRILNGAAFSIFKDAECMQPVTSLYKLTTSGERVPVTTNVFADADDGAQDGVIRCTGLVPGTVYYLRETTAPAGFEKMQDDFTIKLDLNTAGTPSIIALDKDGRQYWNLSSSYTIDEDNKMRILLDVFNNVYIGGDTEIGARKVWEDGDQTVTHEAVTIKLLAKKVGETEYTDTGIRMFLNDANGWQNAFINLQKYYTDDDGLHEFDYTVEEIVPEDYTASKQAVEIEITQDAYWQSVTSLEAGKTYRFVAANGRALAASSQTAITSAVSNEEDANQQWIAETNGSGIALRSAAYNGRYLNTSRTGFITYSYSASLSTTRQNASYSGSMLQVNGNYITVSNTAAGAAASGTALTAYELVEGSTRTIPGYTITNTPVPTKVSVNIQKVDQGQQPIMIKGVTFELYGNKEEPDGENEDSVTNVPDLKNPIDTCVTDENGEAVIEGLTPGEIYWIVETIAPDGYLIMPEPHAFRATNVTDDGNFEVIDYNDAYLVGKDGELLIVNFNGYVLPETGGSGLYLIYILGAMLIASSLIFGYKLRRRQERGVE